MRSSTWSLTKLSALLLLAGVPALAQACEYPDLGNLPLRRAVSKVKFLPQTEAWSEAAHKTGVVVQYALLLEQTIALRGHCYWTLEARAGGQLWRRFYVTPDGTRVLDAERKPIAAPQAAKRSGATTAARP